MRVVVDASIVAAALVRPDGWSAIELSRRDVEWLAPAYLLEELEEHADRLAGDAGLTAREFRRRVASLRMLRTVPATTIARAADDPRVKRAETIDPDDAVYLATAIATEADFLWTRDRALLKAFPGLAVAVVPREESDSK